MVPYASIKRILFCLGLLVLPFIITANYHMHLLILVCIYSAMATSLNLIVGYAGQASLCHGAIFGLGAYASALLTTRLGVPTVVSVLLSGIIAAALALPIGLASLRFKGVYFAVATLGLQQIVNLLIVNMDWLTRGPRGITGIPAFTLFGEQLSVRGYYYAALFLAWATYYIIAVLVRSRTGLEIGAIQGDETTARTLGVDTYRLKVSAFMVSSFLGGLAGAFFAHYFRFVSPNSFNITLSISALTMVLAGGRGTLAGPILGAAVLTILSENLRSLQNYQMLVYGVSLILLIVFLPKGISGVWRSLGKLFTRQVTG